MKSTELWSILLVVSGVLLLLLKRTADVVIEKCSLQVYVFEYLVSSQGLQDPWEVAPS